MVRDINTMNSKIVTMILLEIPANLFRRLTLKSFVLLILIFMGVNACATKSSNSNGYAPNDSSKPPNFIVILADDLGWSSLSVPMDKNYPNAVSDYHKTPNINAIIEGGLRFSSGYAAAPVCSPTRYSIQFGKSPARLKRTRGLGKNHADHNQVGIPQVLKSIHESYRTAHIGKWHIDKDPSAYGYDVHDGITKNKAGGFINNKTQWHGYADKDPKLVHSLTKRAVKFMRESVEKEQPFFVQISHYAVHSDIVYSNRRLIK